jgi:hypothetical protein
VIANPQQLPFIFAQNFWVICPSEELMVLRLKTIFPSFGWDKWKFIKRIRRIRNFGQTT